MALNQKAACFIEQRLVQLKAEFNSKLSKLFFKPCQWSHNHLLRAGWERQIL